MHQAEMIRQKVKQLLNESLEVVPAAAPKCRWREAVFAVMAIAFLADLLLLDRVTKANRPLYLGADPYGNSVVEASDKPLTGKVYSEVDYTPGTKLIPSQEELKERTALKFPF